MLELSVDVMARQVLVASYVFRSNDREIRSALWIFIAAPFLTCEDPAAFSSVLLVTNTRVVPSSWLLSPPPHAGRALRAGLRGRARARARDASG